MTPDKFAERVQHLFPGAADLAELADTLKQLRDAPAPAAVLIDLRYYRTRVAELSEQVIIWQRRAEGKPAFTLSPDCPAAGSWEMAPAAAKADPPPIAPERPADSDFAALCTGAGIDVDNPPWEPSEDASMRGSPPSSVRAPRTTAEKIAAVAAGAAEVPDPPEVEHVEPPADDDILPPRHRFRAARQRLGLSQAGLAARMGLGWTAAMVSQVETARRPCSSALLRQVEGYADAL